MVNTDTTVKQQTQRCPRCEQYLPLDAYHPDKQGKPGHYCRDCTVEYKRQWREARLPKLAPDTRRAPVRGKVHGPRPGPKKRQASTTYRAVHRRVWRERGPATAQQCAHCAAYAEHWAYDHTDPAPLVTTTWKGASAEYSTDASRYKPLCRPCHARFDIKTAPRTTNPLVKTKTRK